MQRTVEEALAEIHELIEDNTSEYPESIISELKSKGYYPYHVIDEDCILGGLDHVHMISYCCIYTKTPKRCSNRDLKMITKCGIAFAYVINTTWNIKEYGDILVRQNGRTLERIG